MKFSNLLVSTLPKIIDRYKYTFLYVFLGMSLMILMYNSVPDSDSTTLEPSLPENFVVEDGNVLEKFSCWNMDMENWRMQGVKKRGLPPKAVYYNEPKEIELQSCEVELRDESGYIDGAMHQLYRKCDPSKTQYTGMIMITAELNDEDRGLFGFPDTEHHGLTSHVKVLNDNAGNTNVFGTKLNPTEPLCSYLARLTGNEDLNTATPFNGIITFYAFNGEKYYYSLPGLGSQIACMNLITMLDTSNYYAANIPKDYPGFWYFDKDEELKSIVDKFTSKALDTTISKTFVDWFTQVASGLEWFVDAISQIFSGISDTINLILGNRTPRLFGSQSPYTRDFYVGEPVVAYETVKKEHSYCVQGNPNVNPTYTGPAIEHINLIASKESEAEEGLEQIIHAGWLPFNVESYCDQNGTPYVDVTGVSGIDAVYRVPNEIPYFCNCIKEGFECLKDNGKYEECDSDDPRPKKIACLKWKIKDDPPYQEMKPGDGGDFKEIRIKARYPKMPEKIGVPGAMSGLGRLYQYLQVRAKLAGHDLVAPQNGTRIGIWVRYYDPFAAVQTFVEGSDGKSERIGFPVEDKVIPHAEFDPREGYIIFQDPAMKPLFQRAEYYSQFILPFDVSPYMRALQYNYSNKVGVEDYDFKMNPLIQKSFDSQEIIDRSKENNLFEDVVNNQDAEQIPN